MLVLRHNINLMALGRHQKFGVDITAVDQVRTRQQMALGSILLEGRPHDTVGSG